MDTKILTKSYDLRWVYWIEIDEELYYKMWFAYAVLQRRSEIFIVWCDARLSSESLKQALIEWILDAWKNVMDIWLCSTDMVYFATWAYEEVDIWLMITASHNPKEYNWLKACSKNAVPINMKSFGLELQEYMENWDFSKRPVIWNYKYTDIADDFIEHIASFVDVGSLKKFKIVADAWNWVAWVFMSKLATRLWFELIPLFFEPDGNFPNHHPSPIEPENVKDMIDKVISSWADLWVAFDWDADRMYICDETWTVWTWTITTAMIAKVVLEKNPRKKIIYNSVCWNVVPETIEKMGWIPVKEKVGHVYIKERMYIDSEIIFGWEHSGHYYFRDNWNADSWVIAFAVVLELLSESWKKPSEVRELFENYLAIPEINFKVADVAAKLQNLKSSYKDWSQDMFDWLTVRYRDWWFNVRPSSNEPLLRLNLEARNEDLLNEKFIELRDFIIR
ncbi:MAG: Phosphomannomutase [uncultured bacterium (gcode 4)]|uniref:Phosphomannomutase n=1 Tax=uncultured bacterium (gcode 4) TaxID=1234023 RepID=K2G667_9BACT|nr:MAG: Phosphomannomutase [uncultured bacterium (gcode 4)]